LNNVNTYTHAGRCVLHTCLWVGAAHACARVCVCVCVCVKRHRSINLTTTSNPDNRQLSPINTVTH